MSILIDFERIRLSRKTSLNLSGWNVDSN